MTNARLVLVCALLLPACAAQDHAPRTAEVIRTAVDVAALACQTYRNDSRIPRDPAVTAFCEARCGDR